MGSSIFINYLKGICAFFILFAHINGAFFHSNNLWAKCVNTPVFPSTHWPNLFVSLQLVDYGLQLGFFAVFSVMMFFLASAFGCSFSVEKHSFASFLKSRCVKLIPLYIIIWGLNILLIYLNSKIYHLEVHHDWKTMLVQLGMSVQSTFFTYPDILLVTWFLGVLWLYYIFFSISFYLFKAITKKQIGTSFLLVIDILTIGHLFLNRWNTVPFLNSEGIEKSLTLFLFMYIGLIFYMHKKQRIQSKMLFLMTLAQLIFSAVIYRNFGARYVTPNEYWGFGLIVLCVFWLSYLYSDKMEENKVLSFLGQHSYVLYLIHGFLGFSIVAFCVLKLHWSKSVACIIALICVLIVSFFVHKYIEKPLNYKLKQYLKIK